MERKLMKSRTEEVLDDIEANIVVATSDSGVYNWYDINPRLGMSPADSISPLCSFRIQSEDVNEISSAAIGSQIFIFGDFCKSNVALVCDILSAEKEWLSLPPMMAPRANPNVVAYSDDYSFVFGCTETPVTLLKPWGRNKQFLVFDDLTGEWDPNFLPEFYINLPHDLADAIPSMVAAENCLYLFFELDDIYFYDFGNPIAGVQKVFCSLSDLHRSFDSSRSGPGFDFYMGDGLFSLVWRPGLGDFFDDRCYVRCFNFRILKHHVEFNGTTMHHATYVSCHQFNVGATIPVYIAFQRWVFQKNSDDLHLCTYDISASKFPRGTHVMLRHVSRQFGG